MSQNFSGRARKCISSTLLGNSDTDGTQSSQDHFLMLDFQLPWPALCLTFTLVPFISKESGAKDLHWESAGRGSAKSPILAPLQKCGPHFRYEHRSSAVQAVLMTQLTSHEHRVRVFWAQALSSLCQDARPGPCTQAPDAGRGCQFQGLV